MKDFKSAVWLFVVFTVLLGGVYPVVVTGLAQVFFPRQAAGSFITDRDGRVVGAALIGQPFSDPKYFWPRPSATADFGYNPLASGGSNLGPTNPGFLKQVEDRVQALRDPGNTNAVPADLVLASASGLDPHLSPAAAEYQITRVASARGLDETTFRALVAQYTKGRQLGILGEPVVNVLQVNLALDAIQNK